MNLNTVISFIGWVGLTFFWLGDSTLFVSAIETAIDDAEHAKNCDACAEFIKDESEDEGED